jgi:multiple sugar transport system ATP-binding protein
LIRIHREIETTMVFVTHDQEEAMAIADRIAVMNAGELVQLGPPLDLYQKPLNLWVARFIGAYPINVLAARLGDGQAQLLADGSWSMVVPPALVGEIRGAAPSGEVYIGVRPEHLHLEPKDGAIGAHEREGEIYTRQVLGTEILYEVTVGSELLRAVTPTARLFAIGQPVRVSFEWSDAFVFERATEQSLTRSPSARTE